MRHSSSRIGKGSKGWQFLVAQDGVGPAEDDGACTGGALQQPQTQTFNEGNTDKNALEHPQQR